MHIAEADLKLNSDQQFQTLNEQSKKVETFGPSKVNGTVATSLGAVYSAIVTLGDVEGTGRCTGTRNEVSGGPSEQDSRECQGPHYQGADEGEDCQTNAVSTCVMKRIRSSP